MGYWHGRVEDRLQLLVKSSKSEVHRYVPARLPWPSCSVTILYCQWIIKLMRICISIYEYECIYTCIWESEESR